MKTVTTKTLAALVCVLALNPASAEIYKWTDADGNVHYGDRPVGDGTANGGQVEVVAIASSRTSADRVQAGVDARRERDSVRADARAERQAAREEEEKAEAEQAARAEKCTTYRARLEKFVQSRRLYRVDEAGERNYLDEAQMAEARAQAQEQVQEFCSPL